MRRTGRKSANADSISWPTAPASLRLGSNEVHVWAAPLDVAPRVRADLAAALSAVERERAGKFTIQQLRGRFTTARGLVRVVLGRYLQRPPEELEFVSGLRGKPALASKFAGTGMHFNVAHSVDLALIAVTCVGPVGVDVEWIRPMKDMEELVERFFSPPESEQFRKVAAADRPAAFFNLWTRKEAMLKATGEGLTGSLSRIEVSFLPGEPARVMRIAGDPEAAAQWSLRELSPAEGSVGAVAVKNKNLQVHCWKW